MIARLLVFVFCGALASLALRGQEEPRPSTAAAATRGLLQRLLPDHATRFVCEEIPRDTAGDVFELESIGDRIVLRGNDGVAIARALNWYLKHYAHCDVSWRREALVLPEMLPRVPEKIRRVSWAEKRYFLNYCTFGYSLPWWDWSQWERLVDWMALNGVNLPLSVTGQEAVWEAVGKRLGLTDTQIATFLTGAPFLPFQWMGCLDEYGGPLPKTWIAKHEELGKQILARQRELGMTPVLQGFTGHVPAALGALFPEAKLQEIKWFEWNTKLIDSLDPLFARVAGLFMEEQTRRFGTNHVYAADPFIEMIPPSGEPEYLARMSRAIYAGMARSDPQAVWVLQGWPFMYKRSFWTQPRFKAFLDAIPDDRMLVLDLYCETTPMWSATDAFCGKPWLWCNVQNFGDRVGLGAALDRNNTGLNDARRSPQRGQLRGLGFVNEGLDYNPVAYDFMFEMAWRDEPVDLPAWIASYAHHRYGRVQPNAQRAWQTLRATVYAAPLRENSVITRAPTLARLRDTTTYDPRRLVSAWGDLMQAADELGNREAFRSDLVNVARQALANHASTLHARIGRAWRAKDIAGFERATGRFLALIHDLDTLLATRQEFLLGSWLEDAKRWGATEAERARSEWNARRVITLWGDTPALNDYARKQWSGMLEDYYAARWKRFLDAAAASLRGGKTFDAAGSQRDITTWTKSWADDRKIYSAVPVGDSVARARALWAKYRSELEAPADPVEDDVLDAVSLTTGKPATSSSHMPAHPARLANDGSASEVDQFWATDTKTDSAPWWQVDLEQPVTVGRVVVVTYYGDDRHYGFTVEVSTDAQRWEMVADRRHNEELATQSGYTCTFPPRAVRYIRVTQTHNSANTGRHLVEVQAYEK